MNFPVPTFAKVSFRLISGRTALIACVFFVLCITTAYSLGVSAESIRGLFASALTSGTIQPGTSRELAPGSTLAESAEPRFLTNAATIDTTLGSGRKGHTATLLGSGGVLIAGGNADGSSEIYDPLADVSSASGSMNAARSGHTASRLSDGRVLITGGTVGSSAVASTEIYDPSNGTFSSGPAMTSARSGHTATVLSNGNVLIAGGGSDTAEIFDGTSFTAVGAAMVTSRTNASAVLMADGRVLIAGGTGSNTAEIFNPADGTFTAAGNAMTLERARAHLRVLPDGKVQIIGGNNDGSMEIYDPAIDTIGAYAHVVPGTDTCASLPAGVKASQTRAALFYNGSADPVFDRSGHTITEVAGNKAVVIGGTDNAGNPLDAVTVFNSSPATITTDKLDYAPGETVTFSGTGFTPGETVRVVIHEDPHTHTERNFEAVTDTEGKFTGSYLVEDHDLNVHFVVAARGLTSGLSAQTSFTDGSVQNVTIAIKKSDCVTSSTSFNLNDTVCADVDVTVNGGGTTDYRIQWYSSTSITLANLKTDQPFTQNTGGIYSHFPTRVADAAGTWTVLVCKTNNAGECSPGNREGATTFTVSGNVATTTAVNNASATYGDTSVTLSASVTSTSTVNNGSVLFTVKQGATAIGSVSGAVASGTATASFPLTGVNAGSYSIEAAYTAGSGFLNSSDATPGTLTVAKKTLTVIADNKSISYGSPDPAFTFQYSGGFVGSDDANGIDTAPTCSVSGGHSSPGTYSITCSGGSDNNYDFSYLPGTLTVGKAASSTEINCPVSVAYNGNAQEPCSATATLTGGATVPVTVTYTNNTNAGTALANAAYAGDANHDGSTATQVSFVIDKAAPVLSTTGGTFIYNGNPYPSVGTALGVDGVTPVSGTFAYTYTPPGDSTAPVNASATPYSVSAAFTSSDPNYSNGTPAVNTITINKAEQAINIVTAAPATAAYNSTFNVSATGGASGNPVVIAASGACSGGGNGSATITMTSGTGTCTVTYNQAGSGNYNAAAQQSSSTTAQKVSLTVTASSHTVNYGAAAPDVTASYTGFVGGDDANDLTTQPTCTTTYTQGSPVSGSYTTSCSGAASDNYAFTYQGGTVTVNSLALTASIVADDKTYDGDDSATFTCTLAGAYSGDDVQCSGGTATFDDRNAGTNKLVTAIDLGLSGTAAPNYTVNSTATDNADIFKLAITVDAVTDTKTYDGGVTSSVSPTFNALVGGDTGSATQVFDSRNAGTRTLSVSVYLINDGNNGNNYTVTMNTASGTINQLAITVTAVSTTREYDGTTNSNGVPTISPSLIAGDTSGFTQSYDNRNAGTSKTLTPAGLVNDNNSGNNYSVTFVAVQTGEITPRQITVSAVQDIKDYDGTTSSDETPQVTSGTIVSPDTGSFTQAYADANAGTGKTLIPSGSVNDGNSGNNYNILFQNNTTGVINKINATINIVPYSGTYDGAAHGLTGTATGINGVDLSSLLNFGETFTNVPGGTATWTFNAGDVNGNYNFATGTGSVTISRANATCTVTGYDVTYDGNPHTATGSCKGVLNETLSGLDLSGTTHTDAGNYNDTWTFTDVTGNYNNASSTVFDQIDPLQLTASVDANDKPYDGTTAATINSCTFTNAIALDNVSCVTSGYAANFNTKDVGTNKPVSATGLSMSGTDAANYSFNGSGTGSADITAIALVASVEANDKPYDGTTDATINSCSFTNVVGTEDVTCSITGYSADFDTKNVGTDKTVTATGLSMGGSAAGNYTFGGTGTGTADITAVTLTVKASNHSVTYGDAVPSVSPIYEGFVPNEDENDLDTQPTCSTDYTVGSFVSGSPYTTSCSGGVSGNYLFDYITGTVTVGLKAATWTTNNNSKLYGQLDPSPLTGGSGSGFLAADGVSATYSRVAGSNVGNYHITATLSSSNPGALANYVITNAGATFTINPDPTAITPDANVDGVNNDCINHIYTATLTDTVTNQGLSGISLKMTIGTQEATATTDADGKATFTLILFQAPGTVTQKFELNQAWTDPNRTAPSAVTRNFTVGGDPNVGPGTDADSLYTGSLFFWTTSSSSSTATLTLSATIKDTFDLCPTGDITKAKVSFFISTNGGGSFSPVSNAQNLPVGLVNPAEPNVGAASAVSQYNIGSSQSVTLIVRVVVGGYYNFSDSVYDVPVTIGKPGTASSLMGGGKLKNDGNPYPATGYLGVNSVSSSFGSQVVYNKKGTNPQGQVTVFIRSCNNADGSVDPACVPSNPATHHTYFIKSNSISELSLIGGSASFGSKTNVTEIKPDGTKASLDGGNLMQLLFTPYGQQLPPNNAGNSIGTTCTFSGGCASIVIYRSSGIGGGVWYSSSWGAPAGKVPQTYLKKVINGTVVVGQ